MGDISQHFSRSEHACKCGCHFSAVDILLNKTLEEFRLALNAYYPEARIIIDSGNRCATHNKKVGGRGMSLHLRGLAVDFRVVYTMDNKPTTLNTMAVERRFNTIFPVSYGFITYDTFNHLDVRSTKFRSNEISMDERNEQKLASKRGI